MTSLFPQRNATRPEPAERALLFAKKDKVPRFTIAKPLLFSQSETDQFAVRRTPRPLAENSVEN